MELGRGQASSGGGGSEGGVEWEELQVRNLSLGVADEY